jgi:hypothetical protein
LRRKSSHKDRILRLLGGNTTTEQDTTDSMFNVLRVLQSTSYTDVLSFAACLAIFKLNLKYNTLSSSDAFISLDVLDS